MNRKNTIITEKQKELKRIIVNGVLASCHTIVQSNSLQNSFFTAELPFGMDILATMLDYIIPKDLVTM
ncbi:unnamed protein product [Nippostrongylus brasiliensis]|uniref:CRISPR-associated endonuclease Cas1 n=1 Tax=Nippostrongylus brasiliensis TaxID=27835 RepID=A0A0N4YBH6_NIPBR|nr:unnamed protein product [Nippostrongylus brasiliensis]